MMRYKNLITICLSLLLFPILSYSQSSGVVKYALKIGVNEGNDNNTYNEYQKVAQEGAHKLTFVLQYDEDKSIFSLKEDLQNEDRDAKIAKAIAEYFNPVFMNLSERNRVYKNPSSPMIKGDKFIITEDLFQSWELTKEKKQIQDFTCYKAIGQVSNKGEETADKEIIAWYCPEIPASFGPNGYGKLPGLILELQVSQIHFGAVNIDFGNKDFTVEIPDDAEIISLEEYTKILQDRIRR